MAEQDKNSFEKLQRENESKFEKYDTKVKHNVDGRKDLWGFFGELIEMYIPRILSTLLGITPPEKEEEE